MLPHKPHARGCFNAAAIRAVLVASASLLATPGLSQDKQPRTEVTPFQHGLHAAPAAGPTAYDEATPPLFDNLGQHTWPITTQKPEAQAYFDQGLRLAYGFNHAEARRAFRQAQRLDPSCAICFWGEAYVLGPNINVPMDASANAPALAALEQAQALAANASDKEQALIAALTKRYSADPQADRAALDKAWADALGEIAQRFPEDSELAVLHAEAMMDTQPWDYWTDGGRQAKGRANEIVAELERTMAKSPDHPGAIHLYIHAVEASDRPARAEAGADRLAALMPGAGHVVHMPSHIYYRVGRYRDALAANKAAVAADETYIAAHKPSGPYPLAYYPHNLHFLMAAAQAAGDGETALDAAAKLQQVVSAETASAISMVQPMMAAPYWAAAMFGTPEAVLALTVPDNAPTYVKAMWRYARGASLVSQGRIADAENEIAAIQALEGQDDLAKAASAGIPGPEVLQIARDVLTGRIAQARGDLPAAIAAFERAAARQDGLAYMEPPYWYYPIRQSLGAALLMAGRTTEAEAAFQAALRRAPNNGWALFGLVEAAKARGNRAAAQDAEARLTKVWVGDRSLLELKRL
jgi:tetratricopeptide (TPR) repeat protein